jgi:hypothetical protein
METMMSFERTERIAQSAPVREREAAARSET